HCCYPSFPTRRSSDLEYRLLARSGRVVWIREHGATLRGPDGEPAYGRSFLADITEEKRSHEEREGLLVRERAAVQVGTERQHRRSEEHTSELQSLAYL